MEMLNYGTPAYMDVWKTFYNKLNVNNSYDEDTNGTIYFMYINAFIPWFVSIPTSKIQFYLVKNDISLDEFLENYNPTLAFKNDGNDIKATFVIEEDTVIFDYGEIPSFKTFSYLYNEYADCHTSFDTVSFLNHFDNDLQTFWKEFEATNKEIDRLMGLTDDEIAIEYSHIMNIAQIPENTYDTDAESVDFITQQQKDLNKKGKLQIVREQLVNKRAYTVRQFIGRFKHLFIKVISPTYIPVYVEDEED